MTRPQGLLIDGRRGGAADGRSVELVDPTTGRPWASVASAGHADVDAAVRSARAAFESEPWRRSSSAQRADWLLRLASLIDENAAELADLESRNVGKPIREARDEVGLASRCFQYYAGAAARICGQTIPVAAGGLSLTLRQPLGVCGLIVPWNFPLVIAAWKLAPALAAGNTAVLKPSSQTPLTALRLGELVVEAGFPAGAVNVVPGPGGAAGNALARHPLVRKISFTGSTEVGAEVMRIAADGIKRVTLELGGKSANIVFADADIDRACAGAVASVLGNAGQDCCARSRLLVERSVYERVSERVREAFRARRLGPPSDDATEIGPLVTVAHRERVIGYVEIGKKEGARLVCGGQPPADPSLSSGSYLEPALFVDVEPRMRIAREEIFGPVLCVLPFDEEAEAVRIANESEYGLSSSVWTSDLGRGIRVARAMESGVVSVNSSHSVHLEAPFGGFKSSGLGRELGMAAIDHYSELKSVYIDDTV